MYKIIINGLVGGDILGVEGFHGSADMGGAMEPEKCLRRAAEVTTTGLVISAARQPRGWQGVPYS